MRTKTNLEYISSVRAILRMQGVFECDTYSDKTKHGRTFKFYNLRLKTGERISFKKQMQCKYALMTRLSEWTHGMLNPRFVVSDGYNCTTSLSITLLR